MRSNATDDRRRRWEDDKRYSRRRAHLFDARHLARLGPAPSPPRTAARLTAALPSTYISEQLRHSVFVCLALFAGALDSDYVVDGARLLGPPVDARPWIPPTPPAPSAAPRPRVCLQAPPPPPPPLEGLTASSPPARRKRRRRRSEVRFEPNVACIQTGSDWELHWTALGDARVQYFYANGSDSTCAADCRLRCQAAADVIREFLQLYTVLAAQLQRCKAPEGIDIQLASFDRLEDCSEYRTRLALTLQVLRGEFDYEQTLLWRIAAWRDATKMEPVEWPPAPLATPAVHSLDGIDYLDYSRPRLWPEGGDLTEQLLSAEASSVKPQEPYIPPAWLARCFEPSSGAPLRVSPKKQRASPQTQPRWQPQHAEGLRV